LIALHGCGDCLSEATMSDIDLPVADSAYSQGGKVTASNVLEKGE
jgi:hypothetical protein